MKTVTSHFIFIFLFSCLLLNKGLAGPDQDILAATTKNDLEGVKAALAAGANPNALGDHKNTPLHVAAYYAYEPIALLLIQNKADVNAINSLNMTALMVCNTKQHLEIAKALVAAGANPNLKSNTGLTALTNTITKGHVEVVNLLLKAGANVNEKDNTGQTALQLLTMAKEPAERVAEMKKYEQYGGLKNQKEEYYSPISELALALIQAGADVNVLNKAGQTTLMYACIQGNTGLVKALVERKADVNTLSKSKNTALTYAVKGKGNAEIITLLANAGADVNARSYFNGGNDFEKTEAVEVESFPTPLLIAILNKNTGVAKALIEAKANLNETMRFSSGYSTADYKVSAKYKCTALDLAALTKQDEVYAALKSAGAVSIKDIKK